MRSKSILLLLIFLNAFLMFIPLLIYFPQNIWSLRVISKIVILCIIYFNLYKGRLWAKFTYIFLGILNIIYFIALFPFQLSTLTLNLINIFYFSTALVQVLTIHTLFTHKGIKNFLKLQSKK